MPEPRSGSRSTATSSAPIDHAIASGTSTRCEHARDACRRPVAVRRSNERRVNRWFDALSWPEARTTASSRRARADRTTERARTRRGRAMASCRRGRTRLRPTRQRHHVDPLRVSRWSARRTSAAASPTPSGRPGSCSRPSQLEANGDTPGLVPLGQALFLAGRREEARAPLEEARTLPGARHRATSILALAYLSLIELARGDVERAEMLARDGTRARRGDRPRRDRRRRKRHISPSAVR